MPELKEVTLTLPVSGQTVTVSPRELVGRDREQADIIRLRTGGSQYAMLHALVSRVCKIDGRQLVPEDFSEMSTRDIDAIMRALKEAKDERFFPVGSDGQALSILPDA